jgi:hypothetical protein
MAIDTIKSTAVLDGAISTADLANDIAINTSGAITTTGAFTSQGIDDNSNATAITIDSSENVLIGNTDATPYDRTSGNAIAMGDGLISSAQSGGNAAIFNRMTSDGSIVGFRKGGAAVGSISTVAGRLGIGTGDAGLFFDDDNNKIGAVTMASGTPVDSDGLLDLGYSGARFKDLYLSGGAYLGGTGAANKLDDYEEGTWSPTLSFGGGSTGIVYGTQSATYTKIGNVVNFAFRMYLTNKGSSTGHARVNGLPFAVGGMPTGGVFTLLPARGRIGASSRPMFVYILNGDSSMLIYRCDWDNSINAGADNSHFSNNSEVELVGQYTTNS